MNFRLRRILVSLVVSIFCLVLVTSYEDYLPRNPIEDGPTDWMVLSVMVAAVMAAAAWCFVLLPISCFAPEKSDLPKYVICIPIGAFVGALLPVIVFSVIDFASDHSAHLLDLSPEVTMRIIPGACCGAACAAIFRCLDSVRLRPTQGDLH